MINRIILYLFSFSLLVICSNGVEGSQFANNPTGRFQNIADSLRKERLSPKTRDSLPKAPSDNMPVYRGDSSDTLSKMPKVEPEKDQRMPVKELSDTTNKK